MPRTNTSSRRLALAATSCLALAVSGCAGWGGGGIGGGGPDSINVLMVNDPQMVDLQRLTAEHFTAETGIEVNFTVLPENDVRDKISQEFTSQAGQYDVASLSNFEIPIYARAGWVAPLDPFIEAARPPPASSSASTTSSMATPPCGTTPRPRPARSRHRTRRSRARSGMPPPR